MLSNERKGQTGLEVAVIGMAGRFPGAENIRVFWHNLVNGIESIRFFTDTELAEAGIPEELLNDPKYVKAKGVLDQIEYFDASFFGYNPTDAQRLDPQIRILHECVWEALEDAGYDPFRYPQLIGLYASANANYFWESLSWSLSDGSAADLFAQTQMFDRFISTRISYNLNLRGPSIFVSTACSTSLVAIHMACRGLLMGECNIALAGCSSLALPQLTGYIYQEGMIMSPDGHCRAFDVQAAGTVWGEGAAVVALKTLKNAIADGDHIYAIIKGTAINNDGSRKIGYTAPSVEGQADVIRSAQRVARVEPESISYVETHGTGTILGDPIEIEALKTAFHTDKKQFCRIGSVKTNIGHLDSAAGIAGFMKTVLALKHKQIPPSLHFQTSNPKIDFENSPFLVNNQLVDWRNDIYPLRAGVSSFGIGGTNAHAILEEALEIEKPETGMIQGNRHWQLILVSAKTETALQAVAGNLVEFLREHPQTDLADLAYTLAVGRAHFSYRNLVFCTDTVEAAALLEKPMKPSPVVEEKQNLVFMFPGQGSQYLNMGRELYQTETIFREEIDHCGRILQPIIHIDLKKVLFSEDPGNELLYQTALTQPVIFSVEYALAKLLMNWGLKPQSMIGHSIGEYTAACLAEVFSLEDALALVAYRGQLMQEMTEGAMLNVPLSEAEIRPLMEDNLSLAAVNGPAMCVVSGTNQAIDMLDEQLRKQQVNPIRLHVSHAFHSGMMEPMLPQYLDKLKQVKLSPPKIPFLSNVTGNWITVGEATSPEYWVHHLRSTVKFADGIKRLLEMNRTVLIEVGGGRALTGLVKDNPAFRIEKHLALNSMRHPKEDVSDVYHLLMMIGKLWCQGIEIDWEEFFGSGRRISLPTYPFERKRFWFDPSFVQMGQKAAKVSDESNSRKNHLHDWFYLPSWKQSPLTISRNTKRTKPVRCLVFLGENDLSEDFVRHLCENMVTLTIVKPGTRFVKLEPDVYSMDPGNASDYELLIDAICREEQYPEMILHLWSLTGSISADTENGISKLLDTSFYSLLYLAQAIAKAKNANPLRIIVVSNNTQSITGEEKIVAGKAALLGACKVIPQEFPEIDCKYIDLLLPETDESRKRKLSDNLYYELFNGWTDSVIAYRGTQRWVEFYQPVNYENVLHDIGELSQSPLTRLKEKGTYLITGGLGNIGMQIARNFAENLKAKIILIGHSKLPDRSDWDEYLVNHNPDETISRKLIEIKKLETLGSEVLVFSNDLSCHKQLEEIIELAEAKFGPIHGIIHAAGIIDAKTIIDTTKTDCENCFQAKIYGLITLYQVFKDRKLDFCLLMSSLAAILGGMGFVAYAAANLFMDAFVRQIIQTGKTNWISINWDGWHFNGAAPTRKLYGDEIVKFAITPEEGVKALYYALELENVHQVAISTGDLQTRINKWIKLTSLKEKHQQDNSKTFFENRPDLPNPYVAPCNETEIRLAETWGQVLGINQIGIKDSFFSLGGDSLKALRILAVLRKYGLIFDLKDLFRYPTIEELGRYLDSFQMQTVSKETDELSPSDQIHISEKFEYMAGYKQSQIMENITPFNDVLYIDCFYNAFFPMIRHFNRDFDPFLADDLLVYQYLSDKNGIKIDVSHLTFKTTERILDEIGISCQVKLASESLIHDLIVALAAEKLIILRVDCFYEPIRYDTFQEIHWEHCLLIYGYDQATQIFNILEHDDLNSLSYKPQTISYLDLYRAYQGYLKNFQKGEPIPSFYEFSVKESLQGVPPDQKQVFRRNVLAKKREILNSLKSITIFQEDLRQLVSDEAMLQINLDELIFIINRILRAKYGEHYQMNILMDAPANLLSSRDNVIAGWNYLKIVTEKYKYSKTFRQSDFESAIEKLELIYQLEYSFYKELL